MMKTCGFYSGISILLLVGPGSTHNFLDDNSALIMVNWTFGNDFWLTSTFSTFQSWVNTVFQKYLRSSILAFLDDILIYNSWVEHLQHLCAMFTTLQQHLLFLKKLKCTFAQDHIAYLEHVISPQKVCVVMIKLQSCKIGPYPLPWRLCMDFLVLKDTTIFCQRLCDYF